MSAATVTTWRPVYDASETVEQFAQRQRQAFAAFELAWREGRVSIKLKGYYDQVVRDVGANAYAWWTEERWAEAFDVSASTIKRVLRALTTAGLIRRERQFGASSRTYLTSYDRCQVLGADDEVCDTDNQQLDQHPSTILLSQHDITNIEADEGHGQHQNQNPEASQESEETSDYRQAGGSFFGTSSDPTIGSLLHRDHTKTRHLTIGAAGVHSPAPPVDPLTRQVLEHEGVVDFILAPQLAQQAAGELQAVSQYLDTQATVRDRPRLFAWLATHGFGHQLLSGRRRQPGEGQRSGSNPTMRAPRRTSTAPAPPTSPLAPPPTAHQEVWAQVRDRIRPDGTTPALALWLDALVLLQLADTEAVVGTPNVFVRDAIAPHAAVLAAGLAQVLGHGVEVMVVVDGCR